MRFEPGSHCWKVNILATCPYTHEKIEFKKKTKKNTVIYKTELKLINTVTCSQILSACWVSGLYIYVYERDRS